MTRVLSTFERLALPERAALQAADDAWSRQLRRMFKGRAGDIRYTPAGKGKPGGKLNSLYLAREAARIAYDRACGLDESGLPIKE
jgi:hypothetical protein